MNNRIVSMGAVLLIIFSSTIFAGTFYVATTGNDANNGSINSPWQTLARAVKVARGNDIIYIRGGIYSELEIWVRQDQEMGGSNGKFLTISAYPNEQPIFNNGDRPLIIDTDWIRIKGLDFRNGKEISVVDWHGSRDHVEIINNHFSGTASWATIGISGDSLLIEGNTIETAGNTVGTQGHGIYLSKGSNNIIRGNRISGMTGYGIHIFDQRRSEDAPNTIRLISNILVEGNTVFHSLERAGIIACAYDHAQVQNIIIRKNIIYDHVGSGIVVRDAVTDVKIYNNTIYDINTDGDNGNGGEGIWVGSSGYDERPSNIEIRNNIIFAEKCSCDIENAGAVNVIVSNNLYWPLPITVLNVKDTHPVGADPRFVDAAAADFHLQLQSPAINTGLDVGIPYNSTAPDLGAYEYDNGTAVQVSVLQAYYADDIVTLIWKSYTGVKILGYDIQRSIDNADFIKVGYMEYGDTIQSERIFQYKDLVPESGRKYYYRLKIIDSEGSAVYSGSVMVFTNNPNRLELWQNYPNPFNSSTEIIYALPESSYTDITIFNLTGQEIVKLIDRIESQGMHRVEWDGHDSQGHNVAAGLYVCLIKSNRITLSRKLVLLR
jgi:parallel beta-helix repeat protein